MIAKDLEAVLDALLLCDDVLQDVDAAVAKHHDVQLASRVRRAEDRIALAITSVMGFRGSERAARVMVARERLDADDVGLPALPKAVAVNDQ